LGRLEENDESFSTRRKQIVSVSDRFPKGGLSYEPIAVSLSLKAVKKDSERKAPASHSLFAAAPAAGIADLAAFLEYEPSVAGRADSLLYLLGLRELLGRHSHILMNLNRYFLCHSIPVSFEH
jgi:hypothetical protein